MEDCYSVGRRTEEEKRSVINPLLEEEEEEALLVVPLLPPPCSRDQGKEKGRSTWVQTLGNIIVSILGTGVLGLPYAFRIAGWLAGTIGVILAGISTYYCMLLLVECKAKAEKDGEEVKVGTYGDLGAKAFGRRGRILTESLVFISQCGASVAYLVFIGQNLLSVFRSITTTTTTLTFTSFIFLLLPLEIALSWIRSLSALAPFSALADACNVLAMAIVVKDELHLLDKGLFNRQAVAGIGGLPFAAGVAVFCFEGFSMTLPLQTSMKEKHRFPWVLSFAFLGITALYVCFGLFGYLAYGDQTKDIITLNLPNDWSSIAVKMGLCVGLALTFPTMMHPVHEIVESRLKAMRSGWLKGLCYDVDERAKAGVYVFRGVAVAGVAVLASFARGFGAIISLVGSSVCALLSFVLPATFHLVFMYSCISFWRKSLDVFILVFGMIFACYGTYNAAVSSASH